jgi:hypothetical protein
MLKEREMLGSSCNENSCPGWLAAMIVGIVGYIVVTVMFLNDVMAGEVRVEITRELPEEKQLVVQHFYDEDSFMMWMATKMEGEGCDPYVSEIKVFRNYEPKELGAAQ